MLVFTHVAIQLALVIRVLLRSYREPTIRISWIVVILAVPVAGIALYALLGETSVGRRRVERRKRVLDTLPAFLDIPGAAAAIAGPTLNARHAALFKVGQSISGFVPVCGNRAELFADSDTTIDAMIRDMDAATDHIHVLFYIWLPDGNGKKVAEALMRASRRGVTVRAMADDIGSRTLVKHPLWAEMGRAGVRQARALKVGNPLWRALIGRIDLRNHRKIVVIDNHVTYCGSQNCADPAFLPKARYAPWVDAVMRFEGPVARQNQLLFAADWMSEFPEDLRPLLMQPLPELEPAFVAQVIAEGPTDRPSAAPEMFASLIYAAQYELIVTTPYYVPVDSLQSAFRAAANRGVRVTLILPERNDDFAVKATARSYYKDLISAGVQIFEYRPGLLHTKSVTVDGEITLIGSANMDCRSFALNFENNILLCDNEMTTAMRARQMTYIADSVRVTASEVDAWPWYVRLWNNALAVVGPVL
jgi:cardiolipin synthase